MQAKVPKFIDVEDRVVGPFTWKQFAYVTFSLAFAFMATSYFEAYVGFPIAAALVSLGVASAFVKVNGRPFTVFLESLWHYNFNPRRYYWQKEEPRVSPRAGKTQRATTPKTPSAERTEDQFQQIAKSLDVFKKPEAEPKEKPTVIVQNFVAPPKETKANLIYPNLTDED